MRGRFKAAGGITVRWWVPRPPNTDGPGGTDLNPANARVVYADVPKTTAEREAELADAHAPFRYR